MAPRARQNPGTTTSTESEREPGEQTSSRAVALVFGVGGGIASTVYGTITAMATVAAFGNDKHPWKLAIAVVTTAIVFWIAHTYAHGLSESIAVRRPLRVTDLGPIARRELGIVLAAAPPVAALLLGAVDVLKERTAVWLALAIGLVMLAVQGARYARLEAVGFRGTLLAMARNIGLGLLVVALKVAISH